MSHNETRIHEYEAGIAHKFEGVREQWIRAADLAELFCSWDLAYRCTNAGWLKPVVQGKRRTIYRLADALDCMRRIEAGELPPARPKRGKPSSS